MERGIFQYIIKNSLRQQVIILMLTVASLPFYYASLDLPKQIINKAIEANVDAFPASLGLLGVSFGRFSQLELLIALCGLFLGFVIINGAFKYVINVYKGLLGERMLQRLRAQLHDRILRFPLPFFQNVSKGEMVSIVSAEVEPLGGFIGDAIALPLYQGGLLLTALIFIFVQDPIMGLAVIALYPIQIAVIPRLQSQVNELGRQRVREVRRLSDQVTETLEMAREIRIADAADGERSRFGDQLERIFDLRYQIYRKKFFIKFFNNFIAQLTPFFFFAIGGYLVIRGDLSLGALVAVLAAYKDLAPPWKELIDFYQRQQDARIKYEQIVIRFDVPERPADRTANGQTGTGESGLVGRNLHLDDGGDALLSSSFSVGRGKHAAIVGPAGSGKRVLTHIMAGLVEPTEGSLALDGDPVGAMLPSVRAQRIVFVDNEPTFRNGTVAENLTFGTRAGAEPDLDSPHVGSVLSACFLNSDLVDLAMRTCLDPKQHPRLAERVLEAREAAHRQFDELAAHPLVEPLEPGRFNPHATIGENLIFGHPVDSRTKYQDFLRERWFRGTLSKIGLTYPLELVGYDIAMDAANLDMTFDARDEAASRIVEPEDYPACRAIVSQRPREQVAHLANRHRRFLTSLALEMTPAAYPTITIDEELQQTVVRARQALSNELIARHPDQVAPYDPETLNPALSIRENIVFGRIIVEDSESGRRLDALLADVIKDLDMDDDLQEIGLTFPVGGGGSRLNSSQRQRLGLARGLLRGTDLMVIDDTISGFDGEIQQTIIKNIREVRRGKTLIWALQDPGLGQLFDQVIDLTRP